MASEDIPANGHGGPTTPAKLSEKTTLRRVMRAARRAFVSGLPANALARANGAVAERVLERLGGAKLIAGYVAVNGEVDPAAILLTAHERGLATALPAVESRAAPLRFCRWQPGEPLIVGPFGLLQPPPDAATVEPDLILTPLVAFDRTLGRLGQGAAHYDRALAALPAARRLGLAWSVQEAAAALPIDPWDVPLHGIATERAWIGW